MDRLASVPAEVLSDVVGNLDGISIGRLWFCGHRVLNVKLSRAVTTFSVELGRRRTKVVFPALAYSFACLQSLVMVPAHFEFQHRVLQLDAEKLSTTLKTLDLQVRVETGIFVDSPNGNSVKKILGQLLRNLTYLRYTGPVSSDPWLAVRLPRLNTLDLSWGSVSDTFLNALPDSLDHLTIGHWHSECGTLILNPRLQSLEMQLDDYWPSTPAFLPPNLTSISLHLKRVYQRLMLMSNDGKSPIFPSTLTSMRLTMFERSLDFLHGFELGPLIAMLPPKLALFDLMATGTAGCYLQPDQLILPPTLTSLFLRRRIDVGSLKLLPRSLTTLHVAGFDYPPNADYDSFPNAIHGALPPNLTYLNMGYSPVEPLTKLAFWQTLALRPLEALFVPHFSYKLPMERTSQIINSLPRTLKTLHFVLTDKNNPDPSDRRSLRKCAFPDGLSSVFDIFPHMISILPPNLTLLTINATKTNAAELEQEWLASLPRTLTSLSLDVKASAISTPSLQPLQNIPLEELTLKVLQDSAGGRNWSPSILPSTLKRLTVTAQVDPGTNILDKLPPHLEYFSFQGAAASLTDLEAEDAGIEFLKRIDLPLSLGILKLLNSHIPPQVSRFARSNLGITLMGIGWRDE